jgi:hypothetical protein
MLTRTDQQKETASLAAWAAVIALVLPLLPVFGTGHQFVFSLGFPVRNVISVLLGRWINVAVVAVGILFLRRDRIGVAGGVFAAVAMSVAITIAQDVIGTSGIFRLWQTDLTLTLEVIEGVLLALAATRSIRDSSS